MVAKLKINSYFRFPNSIAQYWKQSCHTFNLFNNYRTSRASNNGWILCCSVLSLLPKKEPKSERIFCEPHELIIQNTSNGFKKRQPNFNPCWVENLSWTISSQTLYGKLLFYEFFCQSSFVYEIYFAIIVRRHVSAVNRGFLQTWLSTLRDNVYNSRT